MICRLLIVLLVAMGALSVRAHDPGISTGQVIVREDAIVVTATFSPTDLALLHPPSPATPAWISNLFELRVEGSPQVPNATTTRPDLEGELQFELSFSRPEAGAAEVRALRLGDLPAGHRHFVEVKSPAGSLLAQRLLSAREPVISFSLPSRTGKAAANADGTSTFVAFLKLGVEHIWTGYDHLLFLFGLLVVCTRFKSIVAIISCFTLAHSITLALATLDVINLPSRYTEPLIAASIIFVGVENLVRRGTEPRGRWALTFVFGLIHGFGFASVLRELGVGQDGSGLAMPLLTFNLGVELGQIAVAAIVLPLVWQLRKNETFLRRGVPALSAIVVVAGLYWFLERTLFA